MGKSTLNSIFVDPRIGHDQPYRAKGTNPEIIFNTSYINNLPWSVTIAFRNGLRVDVRTVSDVKMARELVIRTEIIFQKGAADSISSLLNSKAVEENKYLKILRDSITPITYGGAGGKRCIVEHSITEEMLEHYGERVYAHDLDIVIARRSRYSDLIHPYSQEGRDLYMGTYLEWDVARIDGPEVKFVYVTPEVEAKGLFTRFAGQVVHVSATECFEEENGLHIHFGQAVGSADAAPKPKKIFVEYGDYETMERLGFFRTYEQALNGPSFETAQKQSLVDGQKELERLRMELKDFQIKADLEKARLEHDLDVEKNNLKMAQLRNEALTAEVRAAVDAQRAQTESARREEENERAITLGREKDAQSSRSISRKETEEVLKYLPAVIIGVGTMFYAVNKYLA